MPASSSSSGRVRERVLCGGPVWIRSRICSNTLCTPRTYAARVVWRPRRLGRSFDEKLWSQLVQRAAVLYRKAPTGIELVRPDGRRKRVHSAPRHSDAGVVEIRGGVGELVMHAHGRPRSALITLDGAPDDLAALRAFHVKI